MENERIRIDYEEICDVLPKSLVRNIISKESNQSSKEYKSIDIVHNSTEWLWKSFIKFIMPFQMKTNRKGERKQSAAEYVYIIALTIALMFIIFIGLLKYILIPVWGYILIRALLPLITALIRLLSNKAYYKRFAEEDR